MSKQRTRLVFGWMIVAAIVGEAITNQFTASAETKDPSQIEIVTPPSADATDPIPLFEPAK
jgi:hypothetical protein